MSGLVKSVFPWTADIYFLPLAVLSSAAAQSVWVLHSSRPGSVFPVEAEAVHPGQEGPVSPAAAQVGASTYREKWRSAAPSWAGWKATLWQESIFCHFLFISFFSVWLSSSISVLFLVCCYRPLLDNVDTGMIFNVNTKQSLSSLY